MTPFLKLPLSDIINSCLSDQKYPSIWKFESVTPIPKISKPQSLKDIRKITCTSDFSKVFESFLKQWIIEDIQNKINATQFGGFKGVGTEHLLVSFVDRVKNLLYSSNQSSAVIATMADWSSAFDRIDPTIAITKLIKLGVRPSIIQILMCII